MRTGFDGLEVTDENVLMGVGDGLRVTQIRLGPARLTHCMRWTGMGAARWRSPAHIERAPQLRHQLVEKEAVQRMVGRLRWNSISAGC